MQLLELVLTSDMKRSDQKQPPRKTLLQLLKQPQLEVNTAKNGPTENENVTTCISPTPLDMVSPPAYFGNNDEVIAELPDTAEDFVLTTPLRYDYSEDVSTK